VRLSEDEGKTWTLTSLVHDGPSAYASLVAPPIGNLALLFKAMLKSPYEGIVFRELSVGSFVKWDSFGPRVRRYA
jgi:hypothetical protein